MFAGLLPLSYEHDIGTDEADAVSGLCLLSTQHVSSKRNATSLKSAGDDGSEQQAKASRTVPDGAFVPPIQDSDEKNPAQLSDVSSELQLWSFMLRYTMVRVFCGECPRFNRF